MMIDQISARKKVRVRVALQSGYVFAFYKWRYLVLLQLIILVSSLYYMQAYQSQITNPGELACLVLGGTISTETRLLSFGIQMVMIVLVLLVWGRFLRYELQFRCRIVLAKCRSMSVWYGSLIISILQFALLLSAAALSAVFLTGAGIQAVIKNVLSMQLLSDHNISSSLGLTNAIASKENILFLFLALVLRIVCLLVIETVIWMAAADSTLPLLITAAIGGITLLYPEILWLPVGGTMFFSQLSGGRPKWIFLLVPLCYILAAALVGQRYAVKRDWMTRFSRG